MNLNEAIDHALEKSDEEKCLSLNSQECKVEHLQLAIWLMELKVSRERFSFEYWKIGGYLNARFRPCTPEYRQQYLQE